MVPAITVLMTSIATYYVGKRLIKSQKEALFQEILEYLGTIEGQTNIRNLGTMFAQGISKGLTLGGSALKGKTFGIPNVLIMEGIAYLKGKKTDKAITEEEHTSNSGKFG